MAETPTPLDIDDPELVARLNTYGLTSSQMLVIPDITGGRDPMVVLRLSLLKSVSEGHAIVSERREPTVVDGDPKWLSP